MCKLTHFVEDYLVPCPYYTKPTIAFMQCITTFCKKVLSTEKIDWIMNKCFIHPIKTKLLIYI